MASKLTNAQEWLAQLGLSRFRPDSRPRYMVENINDQLSEPGTSADVLTFDDGSRVRYTVRHPEGWPHQVVFELLPDLDQVVAGEGGQPEPGDLDKIAEQERADLAAHGVDVDAEPDSAHVWQSGLIEFRPAGTPVPDGALPLPEAPRELIEVLARHGYNGELLVPGVPEADSSGARVAAVVKFRGWIQERTAAKESA